MYGTGYGSLIVAVWTGTVQALILVPGVPVPGRYFRGGDVRAFRAFMRF